MTERLHAAGLVTVAVAMFLVAAPLLYAYAIWLYLVAFRRRVFWPYALRLRDGSDLGQAMDWVRALTGECLLVDDCGETIVRFKSASYATLVRLRWDAEVR